MDRAGEEITSLQNPKVKYVARLRTEKNRKREKRILIDGIRESKRAAKAGFQFESLFICEGFEERLDSDFWGSVFPGQVYRLPENVFRKIAFGDRNEGVVAVAVEKSIRLSDLQLGADPLLLVLDGIEKPGNIGAVFRTASAAGVDAVILTNCVSSPYNSNAIRASLGTVFELPFVIETVESVTEYLTKGDIQIVTTRIDGAVPYTDYDFTNPVALVLGSEANGVDPSWYGFDSITIPMYRSVDSLNISVSSAIVAFEAIRQRGTPNLG